MTARRSSAVFAHGHWRKRDMLDGLTPAMRAAIAALGPFVLIGGLYRTPPSFAGAAHAPSTLAALAARGLAEIRLPRVESPLPAYRLTRRGRELAAELGRRAAVRAKLQRSAA